jgi:hypothetical protein
MAWLPLPVNAGISSASGSDSVAIPVATAASPGFVTLPQYPPTVALELPSGWIDVGTVARALHARFEEVSRTELRRLRHKTASLNAAQREQVDNLAVEVVQGIAARATKALRDQDDARIAPVVAQLFRI